MSKDKWIPEIFYEEKADGLAQGLPFVKVPSDKEMPSSVFLCELRDLEEEEKELTVHMYCNMTYLKEKLTPKTLDKVRKALGLKPLLEAQEAGKVIDEKINKNLDEIKENKIVKK